MATRKNKASFTKNELDKVEKKGGTYTLYGANGVPIYDGTSKDVNRRLKEHLRENKIPAKEFGVDYMAPSKAEKKENKNIKDHKGKYNKRKY